MPLVPAVVLLLLFFAGPVLWSFYTAFTNQALSGEGAAHPQFIGLANFTGGCSTTRRSCSRSCSR